MAFFLWAIAWILFVIIVAIFFVLNFYRDPKRKIPKGSNIVAPADGKVISIINTSKAKVQLKKGLFGKIKTLTNDIAKECYVVSIFMSPLDVHINRAPIQGKVTSVKHTKGSFFKAYDFEKSLSNEKNEIIIQNKKLKIKVIQIAGFFARRIYCYAKSGQKLNKGQKIGMIALGSQTILVMPNKFKLKIKLNEHVKAGSTVIADSK